MAGIITIDDGIEFGASNVNLSAILREIADRIPHTHLKLKNWLRDLSGRCSPFADFHILGLEFNDRVALLSAIEKTKNEITKEKDPTLFYCCESLFIEVTH